MIRYIDLFAGCGGLSDGFEATKAVTLSAAVEWEKNPLETFVNRLRSKWKINDAEEKVLHFDIQRHDELFAGWSEDATFGCNQGLDRLINKKSIDLIIGGPPCQAYSLAGRIRDKNGMRSDYRNYLFESYLRVVDKYSPKVILFENVMGILSAKPNGIPVVDLVSTAFRSSGFEIVEDIRGSAVFDVSDYGVPQKRKRVILIGLNRKYFKSDPQKILSQIYENIRCLSVTDMKTVGGAIGDLPKLLPTAEYHRDGKKLSHTSHEQDIQNHIPRFHNKRDIGIFRELANDLKEPQPKYGTIESIKQLYFERTGRRSNVHKYHVLRPDLPSNTIPAHLYKDGLRHIHPDPSQARSITVREAARLQSFDNDFIFSGSMGAQYKMVGNAVPPKFSRVLANVIAEVLS